VDLEGDRPPRWQRRLAALGWREPWAAALRLSRADARALEATAAALAAGEAPEVAAYRHGRDAALDAALVRAASAAAPLPAGLDEAVERGASARFPMRAADVPLAGPALGAELRRLEEAWVASGFTLDPEALRRMIRRR
jgi:poly(A) polymerase